MSKDCPRQCDIFPTRIEQLNAQKMAILVVDVQNWVMDEEKFKIGKYFYEEAKQRIIPNIQRLLEIARKNNVEVIFTVIENFTRNGRDRSLDYKMSNFFVPKGSNDAKVITELAVGEDEMIIPKTSSSLFNSTNFEYLMRNIGIETIGVCGFLTDQCVDQTIRDGADRGFRMICVEDAWILPNGNHKNID